MKLLKLSLLSFVALLAMTSCMKDKEGEQTLDYFYRNNVSYVIDLNAEAGQKNDGLYTGGDYSIRYNLTKGTADISVANLQLSPTLTRVSLNLPGQPFKLDETGSISVVIPNFTSVNAGQSHLVSNFKLRMTTHSIQSVGSVTYFDIYYIIDNRFEVRVAMQNCTLDGSTKITNKADGTFKLKEEPYYGYYVDLVKNSATVYIGNFTIDGKYYQTLTVEGLSCDINARGMVFKSESPLHPKINGNEDTSITLNNLVYDGTYLPSANLKFLFNGKYEIDASLSSLRTVITQ